MLILAAGWSMPVHEQGRSMSNVPFIFGSLSAKCSFQAMIQAEAERLFLNIFPGAGQQLAAAVDKSAKSPIRRISVGGRLVSVLRPGVPLLLRIRLSWD